MECTDFPAGRQVGSKLLFHSVHSAWKGVGASGDTEAPRWTDQSPALSWADPAPPAAQVSGGWGAGPHLCGCQKTDASVVMGGDGEAGWGDSPPG